MTEIWRKSTQLFESGEPFVVVTLVSHRGSAPQEPGAKALVTSAGLQAGTVGGGKIEARSIAFARELLAPEAAPPETERALAGPLLKTWNLQRDIGMSCGGEVTLLFEAHNPRRWPIVIFGAGHVAQALTRVLMALDCAITCYDAREEWLQKLPSSAKLTARQLDEPARVAEALDPRAFVLVMTQGHATDVPILEAVLKSHEPPFIGVIGSDVKGRKIRAELLERGVPPSRIDKIRCPVGLPLGGNDPSEIAISVAAQLLQERDLPKSVTCTAAVSPEFTNRF
ncbi:MAG TPA: xanthine dehydrogenase accessory protein XdhC [Bdellovibrionales bacterium]|nr:xanthine dehydrogenase accessory protein XdhC [Bdellovibrionales bacterium]